jgi:hypothetical protein
MSSKFESFCFGYSNDTYLVKCTYCEVPQYVILSIFLVLSISPSYYYRSQVCSIIEALNTGFITGQKNKIRA